MKSFVSMRAALLCSFVVILTAALLIITNSPPKAPESAHVRIHEIAGIERLQAQTAVASGSAGAALGKADPPAVQAAAGGVAPAPNEPNERLDEITHNIIAAIDTMKNSDASIGSSLPPRGAGTLVVNPDQQQAIDDLLDRLGDDAELHMDSVNSTLRHLDGDLASLVEDSEAYQAARASGDFAAMALALADELGDVLNVLDPANEFSALRVQRNPGGDTHVFLQQQAGGVPIWGAQLGVHFDANGEPYQASGVYAPRPDLIDAPASPIASDAAIEFAKASIDMQNTGLIEPRAEAMVYWDLDRAPVMAYQVDLVPNVLEYWQIFVSMNDGRVVHQHKATCAVAASGQAPDLLGNQTQVNSWEDGGVFYLIDTSRPFYDPSSSPPVIRDTRGAIIIADLQNQVLSGSFSAPLVTSNDPNSWDPAGVGVQDNFRKVEEYYRNTFNRSSIDDNGVNIIGVIHVRYPLPDGGSTADNASWNGAIQTMFFGDGDQGFVNLPDSLDVTGHEITHGVIEFTANLIYENQSGALNEHIADVFGAMVDRDDWLLGDGYTASGPGLRDMMNPSNPALSQPQPSTFSEFVNLPNTPQGDNGGVHVNSGIPNRMTYLLAEGPQGIGRDKTEQITYRALTTYLTQRSQFIDYRRAMISAARDLHGDDSPEAEAVGAAFDAVEIFAGDGGGAPTPSPAPPTQGDEFNVFVAADPSTFNGEDFSYTLNIESAQGIGLIAPRFVANSRPAVSGDGQFILYVDAAFNLWITNGVEEQVIDNTGTIRTISMSKDQRYLAFTTTDFNNLIHIIDQQTGQRLEYALRVVDRNNNFTDLKYADALTFNFRGDFLFYDAPVDIQVPGQEPVEVWGIYALRVIDGVSTQILPSIPGRNIGNPMMANTTDHNLVGDIIVEDENGDFLFGMLSIDFITQRAALLPFNITNLGQPTFSADDSRMLFRHFDGNAFLINEAAFTPDKTSFVEGSIAPRVSSVAPLGFPLGFRVGEFVPVRGEIAVAPAVEFGPSPIDQQENLGLLVVNQGAGDLHIIEFSVEGPDADAFGFRGSNQTIAAGDSLPVDLAFRPAREGEHNATLRIRSTDPDRPSVEVSLSGTGSPAQATPPPVEPTAVPTMTPVEATPTPPGVEPTATPMTSPPTPLPGEELVLVSEYEFGQSDLTQTGWAELAGGFNGTPAGSIELVDLQAGLFEATADGRGLSLGAASGELAFIFTQAPVDTLGDPILVRAKVRAQGPQASLALGALRGGFLQQQQLLDGSIGITFPNTTQAYIDREGWINLLYQPDQGDFCNPFIQLAATGTEGDVALFIDRVEIYRVPEAAQIPGSFVSR